MNCLLTAATYAEIAPAVAYYKNAEKRWHIDFELDVLVTGPGMLQTAYLLTKHIALRKLDLMVQAGVAGGFTDAMKPGKVVAVQSEVFSDIGVMEKTGWHDLFDMRFVKKNEFPFKNGRLVNPDKVLLQRSRLPLVRAATVNQVSTQKKQIAAIAEKYKPQIETMEGAAFHYVALREKIPFLQVRAISNRVGERNKSKWALQPAIENLNRELIRLFEAL
jgi:futalosine hydrolase